MIVSKQQVIEHGLEFLRGVGTEAICEICIPSGGSCCKGCSLLEDRVGCQARNTSCTAWLCGFQQVILYEMGLLNEWRAFWDQIPGQSYREDSTPDRVYIYKWMDIPDTRKITEAFARDLDEMRQKPILISLFNDKIFKLMENLAVYEDTEIVRHVGKKITAQMKDFKLYKEQLDIYLSQSL
jgi:hypothetical protein